MGASLSDSPDAEPVTCTLCGRPLGDSSDDQPAWPTAGRDKEMRALIAELDRDSQELALPMAPAAAKEMHFRAYASARMRNFDGTAFRRSQRS